ncbi:MAG: polysaccharide biosynthesis tyrosine autokinase [Candidatus Omnitrophota bacterium]|jgi:capsular exopolysaccharide synthesis family protein|nr:MAG: polysaccharide biosynthesis tyrosine autokinase [Candidatus Omnitrophota bacterium]
MGKITEALKKAAQERLARIEKLDNREEVKFEFIAKKQVDSKIDPRIVTFHDPKSSVSEQYKMLRTNLAALGTKKPVKVMTITSSTHSEGKTITAINLAISMAHDLNNKNILLVDADMRRARITRYLGVASESGLSDILNDGANIDQALLNIGINNLTILPSGKIPHNPAELLGSGKFKNLVAALKNKYDYVIFDTPPIISVTDAGILGAQTDGVIMVIQANRTQKGVVKHAETLLRQAEAKLLGYILTNIQYHIPAYIYRYL